jgi:hypothetical protein
MSGRRHYRLETRFGPEELFKALREACAASKGKDGKPAVRFDFDWLKRKVALLSPDKDAAESALEHLILAVDQRADRGLLLPGDPRKSGLEWELPVGVLLQTPDVYAEVVLAALAEMGIKGAHLDEDGAGFTVPDTALARAANSDGFVMEFPLPAYLSMKDLGPVEG